MMLEPAAVDVLIVEYHAPSDLANLLASIPAAAGDLPVAVWVGHVLPDDGTVEATRDWITDAIDTGSIADGTATVWADNLGYNRALNRLATLGTAPTLLCLNSDVILSPGSIEALATATQRNPKWGVAGPRQTRKGRITFAGIFGDPTSPRFRGWMDHAHPGRYETIDEDATYIQGSVLAIRRPVWDELTTCLTYRQVCTEPGPWLDCDHYYADSWLSLHALAHGYQAVYVGTVTVEHRCGQDRDRWRDIADLQRFRDACDAHGLEHE